MTDQPNTPEESAFEKWKQGFGFASLTTFALDNDEPGSDVADLKKRLRKAFLAGMEAQEPITRAEIANMIRDWLPTAARKQPIPERLIHMPFGMMIDLADYIESDRKTGGQP